MSSGFRHDLQKIMRRFGRQCRGQGHVFVKLVRETETQFLAIGQHVGFARCALPSTCMQDAKRGFSTRPARALGYPAPRLPSRRTS